MRFPAPPVRPSVRNQGPPSSGATRGSSVYRRIDHAPSVNPPAPPPAPQVGGQNLTAGPATPDSVPLASFGRRVVASVIDRILVSFLAAIVRTIGFPDSAAEMTAAMEAWIAALQASGGAAPPSDALNAQLTVLTVVTAVATFIYGVVLLGVSSRTFGQRMLGLTVVPVGEGEAKLGWPSTVSRSLAWTVLSNGTGTVMLIVQLISVSMAIWHPKRQTLPDLLARTQVVRRPRQGTPGAVVASRPPR